MASGLPRRRRDARTARRTLGRVADAPIGIFDSGFGGLTVARAVLDQLPHEPVLYVGDTARQPYGPRPIAEVRAYALECLDHLVDQGVKMLVIACNSASAAVLRDARERYAVPVVEVIRPAVRRAVAATRNGHVGVISTAGDQDQPGLRGRVRRRAALTVTTQACPRFVEFVERGVTGGAGAAAGRARVPRPGGRGRRRHPDPRLHALPAADRRDLLRHGRRRDPGVQRRGDRQGRLPDARGRAGSSAPTGCPSPSTGSSPPATRRRSASWAGASSGRRSACVEAGRREAHGRWVLRLLPRARLARRRATCVEADGFRARARPRQRRARPAAAARRPRATSTPCCSATCTPTTASTCCRSTSPARYDPDRQPAPLPVYGPAGRRDRLARPTACDRAPACDDVFDFVEWSAGTHQVGPFAVTVAPDGAPGRGVRDAGRARRAGRWPTPATPGRATPGRAGAADADLVLCRGVVRGRPGRHRPTCT